MSNTSTLTRKEQLSELILHARIGNLLMDNVPLPDLDKYRNNPEQLTEYLNGVEGTQKAIENALPGFYIAMRFKAGVLLLDHHYDEAAVRRMSADEINTAFNIWAV